MAPDASPPSVDADRGAIIGVAFLVLYAALVAVPWVFLTIGIGVAGWMVPLAAAVAAGAFVWLTDRPLDAGLALTIVGGVLLLGIVVALSFYDASVDGRWYHQSGVLALTDGWNPISNADPGAVPGAQYVRSYPKAFWYAAAPLQQLTGSVEAGKALHFLPLGASFFLSLSLLVRFNLRTVPAAAGAALAAANPIWILESLSYYVDGQIAALLLVAIIVGIWIIWFGIDRLAVVAFSVSMILLVNLKFTGLLYAGLMLLGLGGVLLWQRRRTDLRTLVAVNAVALVVAVGVIGFNPYVQNMLDFGNPFYPIYGEGSVDFITDNTPANLRDAPQVVQLFYGIFSKPANPIDVDAELAVPFSPANLSIEYPYTGPGARTAGLGPLFSGALLLAGAGLAWLLVRERRKPVRQLIGLTVLFLAATVIVHPEGWWARYTPQLWLIPVTVIVAAWTIGTRRQVWMGVVLGVVLAANLVYVVRPYTESNFDFTRDVNRMYEPFVEGSETMAVHLGEWAYHRSTLAQMTEAGVMFAEYDRVDELPCPSPVALVNGAGSYCPPADDGVG